MSTSAVTIRKAARYEIPMAESFNNSISDSKMDIRIVEQRAHELISRHYHFRGRARNFEYQFQEEVLIVRGKVPTFYLKQLVPTVLKELEGVAWIDNRVDVVSSHGMSSVCPSSNQPTS